VSAGAVALDSPSMAHLSPAARDLLDRLLQRDPERRITADAALCHPWMAAHPAAAAA
jgi:calcium-dependent protein kinase